MIPRDSLYRCPRCADPMFITLVDININDRINLKNTGPMQGHTHGDRLICRTCGFDKIDLFKKDAWTPHHWNELHEAWADLMSEVERLFKPLLDWLSRWEFKR